jgi:glycosyltransferase involved in cell wall biosynthesis
VSRRTPFETFFTNAVFSRIAVERELAQRRPDVMVFSSYDTAYGWFAPPRRSIPTAYIYHSSFYSPAVDRVARKPVPLRWMHPVLDAFLRRVERTVFERADAVVAVSAFSKREIEDRLGRGPYPRVVVIPTGVDAEAFSPGDEIDARRQLGVPQDARLLVTAGRLAPVKRYDRAIDAVGILAASDPDYQLLIVGSGPEREALESHARARGVAERVRFAGHLDGDELVAAYRSADVVLCTSDFENWSLALLEAQACGALVVGTPRGSIPEMLGDDMLVAADVTPHALATTTAAILGLPAAKRDAMRARARERVMSRFSWDSTVAALERTLLRLHGDGREVPLS